MNWRPQLFLCSTLFCLLWVMQTFFSGPIFSLILLVNTWEIASCVKVWEIVEGVTHSQRRCLRFTYLSLLKPIPNSNSLQEHHLVFGDSGPRNVILWGTKGSWLQGVGHLEQKSFLTLWHPTLALSASSLWCWKTEGGRMELQRSQALIWVENCFHCHYFGFDMLLNSFHNLLLHPEFPAL